MAREFCQVTILIIVRPVLEASRSKLVCGLVKLDSFNLAILHTVIVYMALFKDAFPRNPLEGTWSAWPTVGRLIL